MSAVQVFWKLSGKRRNCSWRPISPFPTVFSTRSKIFMSFSSNLKSANCFGWKSLEFVVWKNVKSAFQSFDFLNWGIICYFIRTLLDRISAISSHKLARILNVSVFQWITNISLKILALIRWTWWFIVRQIASMYNNVCSVYSALSKRSIEIHVSFDELFFSA